MTRVACSFFELIHPYACLHIIHRNHPRHLPSRQGMEMCQSPRTAFAYSSTESRLTDICLVPSTRLSSTGLVNCVGEARHVHEMIRYSHREISIVGYFEHNAHVNLRGRFSR